MRGTLRESRRALLAAALLLLLGTAGCESGGKQQYPVRGTVTLHDGTPLTKGMVIFESKEGRAVTARGEIKPDGSYQLSTDKHGDGVPPGKYRVHLSSMDLSEVLDEEKKLPYDVKYLNAETSGLEYEVKSDSKGFSIRLERPNEQGKVEPQKGEPK